MTFHGCLAAPTVHCGSNPRWLRPCRSAEEVPLQRNSRDCPRLPQKSSTKSAPAVAGLQQKTLPPSHRHVWPLLRVAVADCPCEDGPRLQPLPIAKSRGERSRTISCKHAPVQFGFDGFDILYRLWTLPYNFLTRIVCATVSVIARRRRASPARVDISTAPRSAPARFPDTTSAISAHRCVTFLPALVLPKITSPKLRTALTSRAV